MNRKHFSVETVIDSGKGSFNETGAHFATDEEIIDWFLDPARKCRRDKITDIKIQEQLVGGKLIERIDLVMKVIKPVVFRVGEEVTPTYFAPLPGTNVAPPLVPGATYLIKKIHIDKEGNQHLDLGLKSRHSYIRSYETGEELPDGDKIHWCHPGRLKLAA